MPPSTRKHRALLVFACIVLSLLALALVPVHAQVAEPDTLSVDPAGIDTVDTDSGTERTVGVVMGFEKNINTYTWNFLGQLNLRENGWEIAAEERYGTTLITSDRNRIKDDQSFTLSLAKPFLPGLALTARVNSFIFSDTRTQGLNKLSTNKFLSGVRWEPWEGISFNPSVGYAFDNQQSVQDQGMMFSGIASVEGYRFGANAIAGTASYTLEAIEPREQNEQLVVAQMYSDFGANSSNQAGLHYRKFRRDFYILGDTLPSTAGLIEHPIETRDESLYSISDALRYEVSDPLTVGLNLNLTQRNIQRIQKNRVVRPDNPVFDSDVDEFRADAGFELEYNNRSTSVWKMRLDLSERDETHTISSLAWASPEAYARQQKLQEQKNNTIGQTQLSVQFTEAVSPRDTLTIIGSSVKMAYDTPSEDNSDDRDELFLATGLRWMHRFSPSFTAGLQGDATLRHTVFLFSERSANNNWNRIFRIAPTTHLRVGDAFQSVNTGEVLANYTVYDFEDAFPDVRSFSFRQLTLSDSTTVKLGRETSVSARVQLRFYERGEFRWNEFKVRPTSYFDERTYVLFLTWESDERAMSAGFRMFEQTRYEYQGTEREKSGTLQSYGPTARAQFRSGDALGVLLDCWYQITSDTGGETRATPSVFIQVSWYM